ncbi:hypothetical protein D9611_001419 [Ephemerocybe angulata]|uniref:NTF2-like protein n=1 Tax=Ephemerocybe angulata TaxID=980116 RepID=A0A8H5CI07_9AGAR|nr:hypothetical protein D9611_001419 [Tulosesus angulatus]
MFSTQTPPPPTGSKAIAANALRSAGLIDKDTQMRDATDKPGGRKGSSKIRSHRNRPIDTFKDQRPGSSGSRTGGRTAPPLLSHLGVVLSIYQSKTPEAYSIPSTPLSQLSSRISASTSHAGPSDPLSIRGAARPTLAGRMRRNAVSASGSSIAPGGRPATVRTTKAVESWREVVRKRWDVESQFLNLESLIDDELVKKYDLTPPGVGGGSAREAAVIFKLASELKPPVRTLSLANNKLVGEHLQYLAKYLPKLANLSLQNNNLRNWKDLDSISARRDKLVHLRELVLLGNPVRELEYKHDRIDRYKHELTRRFSSLELLDSEPVAQISFDVPQSSGAVRVKKPDATTFPTEMKPSFVAGVDGNLVSNFCVRFFEVFDTQRSTLMDVYDPQATFSFSVNTTIPERARVQGLLYSKEFPNQRDLKWNTWLASGSRNLNRISGGLDKNLKALHVGSEDVIKTFEGLPATKHDIGGPPERFCLDAYPVPLGTGTGLLLAVHGQFAEVESKGVRSFDRTFVLAPAPAGSRAKANGWDVVIVSDQWSIRAYSSCEAWKAGPLLVQAPPKERVVKPPTQQAQQAQQAPVSADPIIQSISTEQQSQLAMIPEPQRQLVIDVMKRTNLNVKFAVDCLLNNDWNVDRALVNFEQVKATLGRDAYL